MAFRGGFFGEGRKAGGEWGGQTPLSWQECESPGASAPELAFQIVPASIPPPLLLCWDFLLQPGFCFGTSIGQTSFCLRSVAWHTYTSSGGGQ